MTILTVKNIYLRDFFISRHLSDLAGCKSSANSAIVTLGLGPRVLRQICTELFLNCFEESDNWYKIVDLMKLARIL